MVCSFHADKETLILPHRPRWFFLGSSPSPFSGLFSPARGLFRMNYSIQNFRGSFSTSPPPPSFFHVFLGRRRFFVSYLAFHSCHPPPPLLFTLSRAHGLSLFTCRGVSVSFLKPIASRPTNLCARLSGPWGPLPHKILSAELPPPLTFF